MIVYNGVSVESVAPVKIEDIKVSPIRYNPIVRPRAVRFGSEFVRMGGGERTVTVTFAILERNRVTREEAFRALSRWARTDAEYRMELPQAPTRYLECVCTGKPEPSTRAWWENKLRLVFTCYHNPFWTNKVEKSAACGDGFYVLGDAMPYMRILRTLESAASDQSYSNGAQTMTFSTIPAGDMEIDLNAQTARVGNASIMSYYQPSGEFIVPALGTQIITGTGEVRFRERWE